jgi:hypothetical protein
MIVLVGRRMYQQWWDDDNGGHDWQQEAGRMLATAVPPIQQGNNLLLVRAGQWGDKSDSNTWRWQHQHWEEVLTTMKWWWWSCNGRQDTGRMLPEAQINCGWWHLGDEDKMSSWRWVKETSLEGDNKVLWKLLSSTKSIPNLLLSHPGVRFTSYASCILGGRQHYQLHDGLMLRAQSEDGLLWPCCWIYLQ